MAGNSGGVQSVERAFELLELIGRAGGECSLSHLSAESPLPPPTIHRLLRTLVGNTASETCQPGGSGWVVGKNGALRGL